MRAVARALFGRPIRNERAYTLIEVTIAVWIMGLIAVTFGGSLAAMTKASDYTNRKALVEQEVRRVSDAIRGMAYEPCAGNTAAWPSGAYAAALSNPVPGTQSVLFNWSGTVYYYAASVNPAKPTYSAPTQTWPYNASANPACNDPGGQQLTVIVQMTTAPAYVQVLVINKRDGSPQSDDS